MTATSQTPRASRKPTASRSVPAPSRRQELIEVAADLFAVKGFKATTVRDIADAAGVLSGSLYHHFESKEAILDELLSSYLDDLLQQYQAISQEEQNPEETLIALVEAAFASLEEHRAAITVLQNEGQHLTQQPRFGHLRERETQVRSLWESVLREGVSSGQFRSDIEPRLVYRFARDTIWVAVKWYRPGGELKASDLAQQYLTLILHGLRPAAPRGA